MFTLSGRKLFRVKGSAAYLTPTSRKTVFHSLAALVRKVLFCHSKIKFIAELSRAKRVQRSTMGKKSGKLYIQENLVIT